MRAVESPTTATLEAAATVIRRHLEVTSLLGAPRIGPGVVLKLETFLPTGSFKVRGGLAAVAAAQQRDPQMPLVTASAGNHGLGIAYAAELLGANATVVVPETASAAKVRGLSQFSIELVRHGATYDEAEAFALGLVAEKGGCYISPYNDPDVIAGQASIGTEILAQVPDVRTIVVPVGGGGLLAGVGLATANSGIRIIGVEPENAASMCEAMLARRASEHSATTMADGLAGQIEAGSVTIDLARKFANEMVSVSEDEIADAMRRLAFDQGLVVEASGAVGVAAILSQKFPLDEGPTVVLITGRNIARDLYVSVIAG